MHKYGVINTTQTPSEPNTRAREKCAQQTKAPSTNLDDSVVKRLADSVKTAKKS